MAETPKTEEEIAAELQAALYIPKAEAKLSAARTGLMFQHPFFGALAMRLRFKATVGLPGPMRVDGVTIEYDPEIVAEKLTQNQCRFLICQKILHCALGHPWRRGAREEKTWIEACQRAANAILKRSTVGEWIEGSPWDTEDDNQSAEQIFQRIYVENGDDPDGQGPGDAGGDQGGDPPGLGTPGNQRANGDFKPPPAPPADGEHDKENPPPNPEGDWPRHLAGAKEVGDMPDAVRAEIEAALNPTISWRDRLYEFVVKSAEDYTWLPPNRRFIQQGLYLPSLTDGDSEISGVIAVDVSGSVPEDLLKQFAGELTAILEAFPRTTLKVVYVNTRVTGTAEFTIDDCPVVMSVSIGGGTRFQPAFDWVESEQLQPDFLVYLTDLCGECPEPVDYPVLWVAYDMHQPDLEEFSKVGEVVLVDW